MISTENRKIIHRIKKNIIDEVKILDTSLKNQFTSANSSMKKIMILGYP